jgi:hypothetical protein
MLDLTSFPAPKLPLYCPLAVDWGDHLRHPGVHNRGTKRVVDGLPPEALGGLGHPLLAAAGEDPVVSTGGPQSSFVKCCTAGTRLARWRRRQNQDPLETEQRSVIECSRASFDMEPTVGLVFLTRNEMSVTLTVGHFTTRSYAVQKQSHIAKTNYCPASLEGRKY